MDGSVNPYASPRENPVNAKPDPWVPRSFGAALRGGAWRGLKWTTYITVPIAVVMGLLTVGEICFFAWKEPRDMPPLHQLFSPVGFYVTSCWWGLWIGVLIGLMRYVTHRVQATRRNLCHNGGEGGDGEKLP